MADRYLKLTRLQQERVTLPNKGNGFRVVIEASDGVGMPDEIFGFERTLIDPYNNQYSENFAFICGPWDLVTWPVDEPREEDQPAYFRKSVLDLVLPAETYAEQFWEELKLELCNLIAALNAMDNLEEQDTFACGVTPNDDSDDPSDDDSDDD